MHNFDQTILTNVPEHDPKRNLDPPLRAFQSARASPAAFALRYGTTFSAALGPSLKKPSISTNRFIPYLCYMTKKEKILQKIIKVVDENAPDSEVYLYGSQARGNSKHVSDWDLLILLNRPSISFDIETKFMNEFYDLELETGEVISPLIYSKKEWNNNYSITPLYENIKNEGIKLK